MSIGGRITGLGYGAIPVIVSRCLDRGWVWPVKRIRVDCQSQRINLDPSGILGLSHNPEIEQKLKFDVKRYQKYRDSLWLRVIDTNGTIQCENTIFCNDIISY